MDPRSHFLNSLLRLFLVLCGVWLLTLSPQSQTVLYEANFDADAGSSGTAGASPDAWTASVSAGVSSIAQWQTNGGDSYFRLAGAGASCVWESSAISIANASELQLGVYGQKFGGSWTALISVLDLSSGSVVLSPQAMPENGSVENYAVTAGAVSSVVIRIELTGPSQNKAFGFDDVVLTGIVSCTDSDGDGLCDADDSCSDLTACNFSESANGPCQFEDACGVCGGSGTDADNDGICDDIDPCVGTVDACGVCNGPGAIYDCGCADYILQDNPL